MYRLTEEGRETAATWLTDMLRTVRNEFPEFPAALSFLPMLSTGEVPRQPQRPGCSALGKQIAALRSEAIDLVERFKLPRLFALEDEYKLAMVEAELAWVRRLLDDIDYRRADLGRRADPGLGAGDGRPAGIVPRHSADRRPRDRTRSRTEQRHVVRAGSVLRTHPRPGAGAKPSAAPHCGDDRTLPGRAGMPARPSTEITVPGEFPMPESVQPARADRAPQPGRQHRLASKVPQNVTVTGVPIHGHRPVRPTLVIAVFCLGLFMTLLDITIVNIAIPDLVTDLDATLETVLWVGSAYSLVYTVLLITAGRLGDIHGPRRLFLIGLTIFTAASLASGLSQTPGQLIAFRALQGLGAALLAPQGLAIITSILPSEKRGPAFAAIGIMSGLGVLLGPTLGGFLVTNFGWRWIFFLNVPIGIVAIALAFAFMPDVRPGRPSQARSARRGAADRRPVRAWSSA